jgi:hypothetical protein
MKRLIAIILLISGIPVFAQTDRIDSLLNDLIYNDIDNLIVNEKPLKFDFIYAGTNFNSNTYYAGREVGSDMYNISGHFFYYSSTGLFAGASGIWFDQLTPSYRLTRLSVGFSKTIDKKKLFSFGTSYSHILYYKPDSINQFPYKNNLNLGLSFRKKWIGARISGNILFGEESLVTISPGVYSRFTLIKLGQYNKVYAAPELLAFFGPETVETKISNSQDTQTSTDLKEVYSLLNTQLFVPIGISIGDFEFEFGYSINFPTTQDVNISYPVNSYYNISIGYFLPICKK